MTELSYNQQIPVGPWDIVHFVFPKAGLDPAALKITSTQSLLEFLCAVVPLFEYLVLISFDIKAAPPRYSGPTLAKRRKFYLLQNETHPAYHSLGIRGSFARGEAAAAWS
jgi:hypothetical protein